jgi:hypothetical protein
MLPPKTKATPKYCVPKEIAAHNRLLADGKVHCMLCGDDQNLHRVPKIGVHCTSCLAVAKTVDDIAVDMTTLTLHEFDKRKHRQIGDSSTQNNDPTWLQRNIIYLLQHYPEQNEICKEFVHSAEVDSLAAKRQNAAAFNIYATRTQYTGSHLQASVVVLNRYNLLSLCINHPPTPISH